jgi:hypothetical protein
MNWNCFSNARAETADEWLRSFVFAWNQLIRTLPRTYWEESPSSTTGRYCCFRTGRDRAPLFLQEDIKRAERDALRELEERFGGDITPTDLREALVKVRLQHRTKQ